MPKRARLDAELVRRSLAASRGQAVDLIAAGRVKVRGVVAAKAATQVELADPITVSESPDGEAPFASRGGHKLAGALDALGKAGPTVKGAHCLDAGASTGGFTDVLLRRGAARVTAVDVGYGQLVWRLREDPRVRVVDRTNVRGLRAGDVTPAPSLVTGDLSFISLVTVLPALLDVASDDARLLLLVKPQFEVGRSKLGSGGVVRDPDARRDAVSKVASFAIGLGCCVVGSVRSPLPGPSGNIEYFLDIAARGEQRRDWEALVEAATAPPRGEGEGR